MKKVDENLGTNDRKPKSRSVKKLDIQKIKLLPGNSLNMRKISTRRLSRSEACA